MSEPEVAIVTGGAQGLGAAIAKALLGKGYKVCVADIQEEKGQAFVKAQQEKFGSDNVIFAVCDVSKEEDYKRIFELTLKEFRRIDLVVNNAGIISEENPRKCVEVNMIGTIIGCQMALEYMGKSKGGKGGTVINIASLLGFIPMPHLTIYTATKHAVVGLTRSYGDPYHFEKDGVLFSALCPNPIDTSLFHSVGNLITPSVYNIEATPSVMSPEYVAEGFLKLLEDKINGSTMIVTKTNGYQYINVQDVSPF